MFFFFNETATTQIYPLSLHDPLPISSPGVFVTAPERIPAIVVMGIPVVKWSTTAIPTLIMTTVNTNILSDNPDRKSTRLNSSHANISYAVFCLKKKNITQQLLK